MLRYQPEAYGLIELHPWSCTISDPFDLCEQILGQCRQTTSSSSNFVWFGTSFTASCVSTLGACACVGVFVCSLVGVPKVNAARAYSIVTSACPTASSSRAQQRTRMICFILTISELICFVSLFACAPTLSLHALFPPLPACSFELVLQSIADPHQLLEDQALPVACVWVVIHAIFCTTHKSIKQKGNGIPSRCLPH